MQALIVVGTALAVWAVGVLAASWYIPKAISVLAIALATVGSAIVAARRAPDQTGRVVVAFAMAVHLLLVGHLASGLPPLNLWVLASWSGGVLAGPLFLHLVTRFPVHRPDLRWLVWAAYGVAAVGALAELAGWLGPNWHPLAAYANHSTALDHLHGEASTPAVMMPGLEFTIAGFLIGLGILWNTARSARGWENRMVSRQAQIMILGLLLSTVPFVAFLPGLLPRGVGQFMSLSLFFFALLPVAVVTALVRPNLYDPLALVRKAMVWAGVSAVALLSYLLLVRPLAILSGLIDLGGAEEAPVFVAAFVVALLIRPLQLYVEGLVDGLFFPERLGFRALLEEISKALATTIKPDDLQRLTAEEIPGRLKATGGLVLAVDTAGQNLTPLTASTPLIPPEHPLRALAEQTRGPAAFRGRAEAEYLGIQIPALLLPLWVGDRLTGLYFLGARETGDTYTEDELRQLTVLSHHLAVAVENVRGYRKIEELNRRALAEVEERNHIAREIHDTLAQGLTGIALQFEIAQMFRETQPEKADRAIARGLELARANLEQARRSVLELRASALGAESLPEALAEAVRQAAGDAGATGHFRLDGAYRPLPARVETMLYRIAQEALHNAVKHARASHLEAVLSLSATEACLTLQDDGVGFDPASLPPTGGERGGFGLTGMRERARLVGGELQVEGSQGLGVRVRVRVPLTEGEGGAL
ncbi:MAG: histidine kinase [Bacillota bacterium]